jgi:hypothetical protein
MVTYYVALPFVRLENGGLAPGQAVECAHSAAAIHRADVMSRSEMNAGAVAFSRSGSPELGEFDDGYSPTACTNLPPGGFGGFGFGLVQRLVTDRLVRYVTRVAASYDRLQRRRSVSREWRNGGRGEVGG